jgi:hypothetical protein
VEVLLGLASLNVIETEAQAGIHRLMWSQQWKPKYTNFGHARKFGYMECEPILQRGTDRMIPRCACHKPVMVKFPDKFE